MFPFVSVVLDACYALVLVADVVLPRPIVSPTQCVFTGQVLAGGTSMLNGFYERLRTEMQALYPGNPDVTIWPVPTQCVGKHVHCGWLTLCCLCPLGLAKEVRLLDRRVHVCVAGHIFTALVHTFGVHRGRRSGAQKILLSPAA